MIGPWTPKQANGWWPRVWASPDGRMFVTYGNGDLFLAELAVKDGQLVALWERHLDGVARSGLRAWAGWWQPGGVISYFREVGPNGWQHCQITVLGPDQTPQLVFGKNETEQWLAAGNQHAAGGGHWAAWIAAKAAAQVTLDGRVICGPPTGEPPPGGCLWLSWPWVCHAATNEHAALHVYRDGNRVATHPAIVPLLEARIGPSGHVLYGGYGFGCMGIEPDGRQVDQFVVPWRWEGPAQVFDHGGQTWVATITFDPATGNDGWVMIRPWNDGSRAKTCHQVPIPSVYASVFPVGDHFLVAGNGDRGQLQVMLWPQSAPMQLVAPRLPKPGKPAWVGYYYDRGRYGDWKPAANCTVLGLGMFADGSGRLPADAPDRMRRAAAETGGIFLDATVADVDAMAKTWNLVAGLVLGEFTNDRLGEVEAEANAIREAVDIYGLAPRPVIFTVMPDQVFRPDWRIPKGVDWLAVEVYFDAPSNLFAEQVKATHRRIDQILERTGDRPLILIAQSYDRNGSDHWRGRVEQLEAIQYGVFTGMAAHQDRVKGIWWFAYARPSGVVTYPVLEGWHTAAAAAVTRPAVEGGTPVQKSAALTITSYHPTEGEAPLAVRAVAEVTEGEFLTFSWRYRKAGERAWITDVTNPATDDDHTFRFTEPGEWEISLRGDYPGGHAETGRRRAVTVRPRTGGGGGGGGTGGGTVPTKPKIVELPTYDQLLNEEGPDLDRDHLGLFRHPPSPATIRHWTWRRLGENWTHDQIKKSLHGHEPADLVQIGNPYEWDGYPDYDQFLNHEGPQIDRTFRQVHGHDPGPGDIRHNAWRRLAEGWTQENILLDLQGLPNDGPTLKRKGRPGGGGTVARRSGLVRLDGGAFVDEGGPFLAVGTTLFWLAWGWKHDRDRLIENLQYLAERGVHYVRALGVVGPGGWTDRVIDPREPDYEQVIHEATECCWKHGLRVQWSIFGGTETTPTFQDRERVVQKFIQLGNQQPAAVIGFEVANEAWQNGFSGTEGRTEARTLAKLLQNGTPHWVAITSPPMGEERPWYQGAAADLLTIHLDRNIHGTGGIWRPVRQAWEVHFLEGIPKAWTSNEPIGPQSSVNEDADPLRLTMAACTAWVCGAAGYVLHTGAGIRGGGREDLARGRASNLWEVQNIEATLQGLRLASQNLPGDLPNWRKENGNTRFPGYPFEVGPLMEEHRILRAYAAVTGGRFVAVPMQVQEDTPFQARRPMRVQQIDPLTWEVLQDQELAQGGTLVVAGDRGNPRGYVLVGEFR